MNRPIERCMKYPCGNKTNIHPDVAERLKAEVKKVLCGQYEHGYTQQYHEVVGIIDQFTAGKEDSDDIGTQASEKCMEDAHKARFGK